jgi:hypothetical protein
MNGPTIALNHDSATISYQWMSELRIASPRLQALAKKLEEEKVMVL